MSKLHKTTIPAHPRAWICKAIMDGIASRESTGPDAAHALREAGKMLVEMEREIEQLRNTMQDIARMAAKLPSNGIGHDIHNAAIGALVAGRGA